MTIVGLFCFEAFDYDKLKEAAQRLMNIDIDKAEKTQITKGKFIATVKGKEHKIAVKDLSAAQEKGCNFCDDLTNKFADVSVGSVGTEEGFSTVIVRSDIGAKLLEGIEFKKVEVNKEDLTKLTMFKKSRANKSFAKILPEIQAQAPPKIEAH